MGASPLSVAVRMKVLPRRHRVAHLRALIRRETAFSVRRDELAALLREELAARFHESRPQ